MIRSLTICLLLVAALLATTPANCALITLAFRPWRQLWTVAAPETTPASFKVWNDIEGGAIAEWNFEFSAADVGTSISINEQTAAASGFDWAAATERLNSLPAHTHLLADPGGHITKMCRCNSSAELLPSGVLGSDPRIVIDELHEIRFEVYQYDSVQFGSDRRGRMFVEADAHGRAIPEPSGLALLLIAALWLVKQLTPRRRDVGAA